jgi:phosphoribosylanthranilate isomerase
MTVRPRKNRIRTSVCANQSTADVAACVAGGVDAVGVLVQVSHRAEDAVSLDKARTILRRVPPFVGRYAVTHATQLSDLLTLAELPIDTIQLHGAVDLSTATQLRALRPDIRLLRAVHVTDHEPTGTRPWEGVVDGFVLDSVDLANDRIGGTGRTHDWTISAKIVSNAQVPVVLAGGLTPENVAEAIARVGPWAVNVNSGVERDGVKDPDLVERFVRGTHGACA